MDLDSLLINLRSEVTPKWHQFGVAVGISEEILKKYSNYPPEECVVEVFDYWLRNYHTTSNPTWKDVANILKKIELHQLAETLLQSKMMINRHVSILNDLAQLNNCKGPVYDCHIMIFCTCRWSFNADGHEHCT